MSNENVLLNENSINVENKEVKTKKKVKTALEIRNEILKKKAEFEKKVKELDRKEAEKKFKTTLNILTKNSYFFKDSDVKEINEFILTILELRKNELKDKSVEEKEETFDNQEQN